MHSISLSFPRKQAGWGKIQPFIFLWYLFFIRVSAFADFSVLDLCPKTGNVLYNTNPKSFYEFEHDFAADYDAFEMNHVFSTADAQKAWLRNVFVGVRATVLFGFQNKERCILCSPWKR